MGIAILTEGEGDLLQEAYYIGKRRGTESKVPAENYTLWLDSSDFPLCVEKNMIFLIYLSMALVKCTSKSP